MFDQVTTAQLYKQYEYIYIGTYMISRWDFYRQACGTSRRLLAPSFATTLGHCTARVGPGWERRDLDPGTPKMETLPAKW